LSVLRKSNISKSRQESARRIICAMIMFMNCKTNILGLTGFYWRSENVIPPPRRLPAAGRIKSRSRQVKIKDLL
jgi:hypothetical protein